MDIVQLFSHILSGRIEFEIVISFNIFEKDVRATPLFLFKTSNLLFLGNDNIF